MLNAQFQLSGFYPDFILLSLNLAETEDARVLSGMGQGKFAHLQIAAQCKYEMFGEVASLLRTII